MTDIDMDTDRTAGTEDRQATERILSLVGLCVKAGRLIIGTPQVCDRMRQTPGRVYMVLEAADTSDNTHGRLTSKCAYYGVPLYRLEADTTLLGHRVGKGHPVAAVGVADEAFAGEISAYWRNRSPATEQPAASMREHSRSQRPEQTQNPLSDGGICTERNGH